jgi:hypothetical protein
MPSEFGGVACPKTSKFDRMVSRMDDEREEAKQWRLCCAAVDARDRRTCRCCEREGNPYATTAIGRIHRHHIVYRSAGGEDIPENVISLCWLCHAAEHAGQLAIVGANANERVEFTVDDPIVEHLFGSSPLPPYVHIVLPSGERTVER